MDDMDMVGTKVDAAERYTVRNLRIREDTAKYLRWAQGWWWLGGVVVELEVVVVWWWSRK